VIGDSVDEEIENRFGRLSGIRRTDTPAREMTVDVHPREAIDEGTGGDLHAVMALRLIAMSSAQGR